MFITTKPITHTSTPENCIHLLRSSAKIRLKGQFDHKQYHGNGFVWWQHQRCKVFVRRNRRQFDLNSHLTMMCDIYGFGVVLLESISGRRAYDSGSKQSLGEWATEIKSKRGVVNKIMDPRLEGNYPPEGALECITLARRCVARKPTDRPSGEEVLQSLEQIYTLKSRRQSCLN